MIDKFYIKPLTTINYEKVNELSLTQDGCEYPYQLYWRLLNYRATGAFIGETLIGYSLSKLGTLEDLQLSWEQFITKQKSSTEIVIGVDLLVHKDYQKLKIATLLYEDRFNYYKGKVFATFVKESNSQAVQFFESLRFKYVRDCKNYYGNETYKLLLR